MATSTFDLVYRSLLGCGFLLLVPRVHAVAQREVEVSISGGVSLAQPAIERQNLTRQFRTAARFNTGAALRLTVPLSRRLGVGVEQRVTGLRQSVHYGTRNRGLRSGFNSRFSSGSSSGIGDNTVHQSGLSLRLYDIWAPGPRWGLDVALNGSYAWPYGKGTYTYEGPLWYRNTPQLPRPGIPLVLVRETERAAIGMVGAEALLRYEWGLRHALLLTATYQYGLRRLTEIRSIKLEYLDDSGAVQQGSLAVISRGFLCCGAIGLRPAPGQLGGCCHPPQPYAPLQPRT